MAKRPSAAKSTVSTGSRGGTVRCAIYTRKSTEEGLEQEFNSLDAQYEACASYVASQRHEGWTLVRERYDDGGFSGSTMERPALQRLLADVAAGKVQIIILYKIDRLTRALSDFAKIVEVLDKAGASFVSVTQSFNTTTSMGRLTLNMLLSFAQFEREVTAERIRDKIAASKARGLWMGGPVPLGYRVENRKLLIDEADAVTVRHIFRRYVALGSGQALLEELNEQRYRTKRQTLANGRVRGGVPLQRGNLFHMLGNRVYLGEIVHKGTSYPGEHPALIDTELWDQVQVIIATNSVERKTGANIREPSLLAGLIRDGLGRKMTPSHAVKGARRYRYYITHANAISDGAPAWRIAAHDGESAVTARIVHLLKDRAAIADFMGAGSNNATLLATALNRADQAAERMESSYHRRVLIAQLVTRVTLRADDVEIVLDRAALGELLGLPESSTPLAPLVLTTPILPAKTGKPVRLVLTDGPSRRDDTLVALLAEAHAARAMIVDQPDRTIKYIATATGQCRHRLARLVKLSWASPSIVKAILAGDQPTELTPKHLLATVLPLDWNQQKTALGFS